MRGLYEEGWQHTHLSAVWELHQNHGRIAFCACGAATPVTDGACQACGEPLFDVFRGQQT